MRGGNTLWFQFQFILLPVRIICLMGTQWTIVVVIEVSTKVVMFLFTFIWQWSNDLSWCINVKDVVKFNEFQSIGMVEYKQRVRVGKSSKTILFMKIYLPTKNVYHWTLFYNNSDVKQNIWTNLNMTNRNIW